MEHAWVPFLLADISKDQSFHALTHYNDLVRLRI